MQYFAIGRTGVQVSSFVLSAMNFINAANGYCGGLVTKLDKSLRYINADHINLEIAERKIFL